MTRARGSVPASRSAWRLLALVACLVAATMWAREHAASHADAGQCAACQAGQPIVAPAPPALRPPVLRPVGAVTAGRPRPSHAAGIVPSGRGPPGRA